MSGHERASKHPGLTGPAGARRTGELEVLGALPNSSNAALLVRCHAGERAAASPSTSRCAARRRCGTSPTARCIGARWPRSRWPRALGWPRIPPTVLRDGPYGPGSVQLFIRFDPRAPFFTLEMEHADVFRRVALFDLAANNADRKGGHCLLDADGDVWMIDHGVCFAVEPKLRTVIWTFIDEPLPADAVADLARVHGELLAGDGVADDARRAPRPRRGQGRARADRPPAGGRPLPRARARRPPVPMAADLTLRT